MLPLAAALCICAAATLAGAGLLRLCACQPLDSAERFAWSGAIGLGVGGGGVWLLGLAGFLRPVPLALWLVALAGLGAPTVPGVTRNGIAWLLVAGRRVRGPMVAVRIAKLCGAAVLLFLAAVSICACYRMPAGHEWDALAYHLADPKLFLAAGRIVPLWTEHHSNFPFTMEMLYTLGLLFGGSAGYATSAMIHLFTAVLTGAALWGFCRRRFGSSVAIVATLAMTTTPLYLWESATAYVDVAAGLYATLAAMAAAEAVCRKWDGSADGGADFGPAGVRLAVICGLACGFGLGIKYLGIIPFVLILAVLISARLGARTVAAFAGAAILTGCPWYIKNVAVMHNPVYPFMFKLFPASRYWSAARGAAYQSEQSGYGYLNKTRTFAGALRMLALTPWRLLTRPNVYGNTGDYTVAGLLGGIYFAWAFALTAAGRIPRAIRVLGSLLAAQFLAWFFSAQFARYLTGVIPVAAIVTGWGAVQLMRRARFAAPIRDLRAAATAACGWAAGLALVFQTVLCTASITVWPTDTLAAARYGLPPAAYSLSEVLPDVVSPAHAAREAASHIDNYDAMQWLNRNGAAGWGTVLYDDTRGFYLNGFYLWGNGEHSSYIPYGSSDRSDLLFTWLRRHKIRYALLNLNWNPADGTDPAFPHGPNGEELEAISAWWLRPTFPIHDWRSSVQNLLRSYGSPVFERHGVVVWDLMAPKWLGTQRP
ncbi:MAG: hypothetical protein KGJ62_05155 [Armatimonadetes bacterium]|nr:hypothetical protein [Armatimonadota bacterium]MDE2205450.1 hypothetical protein [Armatimonadota bacterium]